MADWINSLFSSKRNSISSKRFVGVMVWIIVMAVYIACALQGQELPECTMALVIAASSLLGVDSVTRAISDANNKNQGPEEE